MTSRSLAYDRFFSISLSWLFYMNLSKLANLNSFLRECLKIFRHLSYASRKACFGLKSSFATTWPGFFLMQVQSSIGLPRSYNCRQSSLIWQFSNTLSAFTLFRVSKVITSMFVSEVALALKLIEELVMREYWPRMEPDILRLSRTRSSSWRERQVSIEPSARTYTLSRRSPCLKII